MRFLKRRSTDEESAIDANATVRDCGEPKRTNGKDVLRIIVKGSPRYPR